MLVSFYDVKLEGLILTGCNFSIMTDYFERFSFS